MVAVATMCCLLVKSQLVSLDVRSTPIEFLQPKLSCLFGEPVKMPSYMQNTPLIIRVKDVTADKLREKIAWALNGTWEHNNAGWKLWQTPKQLKEEADYYPNLIRKRQKEVLGEAEADFGVLKPLQRSEIIANVRLYLSKQDDETWEKISRSSPEDRFAQALRKKLPPSFIADANGPVGRTVFSLNPNALQVQLPISIHEEFERMIQEKNVWRDILRDLRSELAELNESHDDSLQRWVRPINPNLSESLISVEKSGSYFDCRFMVFDNSTNTQTNITLLSSLGYTGGWTCGLRDSYRLAPDITAKLSDESKECYGVLNRGRKSSIWTSSLTSGEYCEPTTYITTDLFQIAAENKNLVVVPPLFSPDEPLRFDPVSNSGHNMLTEIGQGWYIARPLDSGGSHASRPSISKLTEMTRNLILKESCSLEDQAKYWQAAPNSKFDINSWLCLSSQQFGPFFVSTRGDLKLWNSLPPDLRLAKSQRLDRTSFSNCPYELRCAIIEDVLSFSPNFRSKINGEYKELTEVTRSLGGTIPNWTFETVVTRQQSFIPIIKESPGFASRHDHSPEHLGRILFWYLKTEFDSEYALLLSQKVQPVDCTMYEMRLHISPTTVLVWEITDRIVLPKEVRIGQLLPEAVAQAKAGYLNAYRESLGKDDDDEPPPTPSLN